MKNQFTWIFALVFLLANPVLAAENTVQLTLNPARPVVVGQTTPITATLKTIKGNKPVTFSDLKIAHTKKLHLLVVDSSLSDYHHIHPRPSKKPGEYVFDFTPKTNNSYRIWADILPISTHHQEYVQADLYQNPDQSTATKPVIDRTVSTSATVDGYTATLVPDGPVKAGEAVMASITLTKDGQNFAQLEPIMGAFAHVVGFGEDYQSILHIHPMGVEPTSPDQRGGPTLNFHIQPQKPGFVKLFAQFRIDDKDVFIPFGIMAE